MFDETIRTLIDRIAPLWRDMPQIVRAALDGAESETLANGEYAEAPHVVRYHGAAEAMARAAEYPYDASRHAAQAIGVYLMYAYDPPNALTASHRCSIELAAAAALRAGEHGRVRP